MDRLTLNNEAIENALKIFAETHMGPALRASLSLSRLLLPVQESAWPDVNYCFSRLTGDGFPMEFSFSSAENAISYTTEIAGPDIPESTKVKLAASLLAERTQVPQDGKITELISQLMQQQDLRYGAWMGGRHGFTGEDRYKIYLEITEASRGIGDTFFQRLTGNSSVLDREHYRLRMISIDNANKWEYYFRFFHIDVWQLLYIMRSIGFAEQGRELLDFITLISKRKVDQSFTGNNLGFSITLDTFGSAQAISIFTYNYKIFEPGDRYIRKKLLEFSDRFGWDFNSYTQITEPIAFKTGRLTNHGLVAFSISRAGTKILQVGLRPP